MKVLIFFTYKTGNFNCFILHLFDCLTLWDRKELATRLLPGGSEFKEAVAKEVAATEQRFAQKQADLEQKITDSRRQYAALEDEFRIALTIEAKRFSEVNLNLR